MVLSRHYHRTRRLAVTATHISDWLRAVLISARGHSLSDETVHVAGDLWLGTESSQCTSVHFGLKADTHESNACNHNAVRAQRSHYDSDLVWSTMAKSDINPSSLALWNLSDGKTIWTWSHVKRVVASPGMWHSSTVITFYKQAVWLGRTS